VILRSCISNSSIQNFILKKTTVICYNIESLHQKDTNCKHSTGRHQSNKEWKIFNTSSRDPKWFSSSLLQSQHQLGKFTSHAVRPECYHLIISHLSNSFTSLPGYVYRPQSIWANSRTWHSTKPKAAKHRFCTSTWQQCELYSVHTMTVSPVTEGSSVAGTL